MSMNDCTLTPYTATRCFEIFALNRWIDALTSTCLCHIQTGNRFKYLCYCKFLFGLELWSEMHFKFWIAIPLDLWTQ